MHIMVSIFGIICALLYLSMFYSMTKKDLGSLKERFNFRSDRKKAWNKFASTRMNSVRNGIIFK